MYTPQAVKNKIGFTWLSCIGPYAAKSFSLLILLLLFLFSHSDLNAQEADSTQVKPKTTADTLVKPHSPHRATIYSLVLPGLGQAYNRKYWKIPVIYGGFGVFYYLIRYNNEQYQLFRDAYNHKISDPDGLEPPVNDYESRYDANTLLNARNDFRRNRDLNYILAGVWYALNAVDAAVDAHLFQWEVDDDLTLRVDPDFRLTTYGTGWAAGGVRISFRF
ncbi:MAG: DUF5683 domain-containing protein [Bacteroidales bacterium]